MAAGLITARRVIFTPNVDIKNELEKTGINITCIDRNGEVVKRVNSSDEAEVEDPEGDDPEGDEPGMDDVPNEGGNTDL